MVSVSFGLGAELDAELVYVLDCTSGALEPSAFIFGAIGGGLPFGNVLPAQNSAYHGLGYCANRLATMTLSQLSSWTSPFMA